MSVLGWHAGIKYTARVHRGASDTFSLCLGSSSVDAVIRTLNDGGLLVQASSFFSLASPLLHNIRYAFVHVFSLRGRTNSSQITTLQDLLINVKSDASSLYRLPISHNTSTVRLTTCHM